MYAPKIGIPNAHSTIDGMMIVYRKKAC